MKININEIKEIDLSHLIDKISRDDMKPIINYDAGVTHYKLLSSISKQLNDTLIIDLGTHHGLSCLALSTNPKNKIISYDVTSHKFGCELPNNVERRVGNIFDLKQESILLESNFIFLDTAHNGNFELKVYEYLRDNKYKGFIIYDDIHFNQSMKYFWNKVDDNIKTDITRVGQGDTGTGLIDFNNIVEVKLYEETWWNE